MEPWWWWALDNALPVVSGMAEMADNATDPDVAGLVTSMAWAGWVQCTQVCV